MFRLLSLVISVGLLLPPAAPTAKTATFTSGGRPVHYEIFGETSASAPLLVLLPGSSGPDAPLYRSQAVFFAEHGYITLLLHYFDAAGVRTPTNETYQAWSKALEDLVQTTRLLPEFKGRPVYVLGYSLGASVALAAGSERLPVNGIAEWYGSLPDTFFERLQGMPPLLILHGARDSNIPVLNAQQLIRLCGIRHFECEDHIYPEEAHGFGDNALPDAERRTLSFFADHANPALDTKAAGANP